MRALVSLLIALAAAWSAGAQGIPVGLPATMTQQGFAQLYARGWDTSRAGTALDLTGYTQTWDLTPSDCSRLGWETFTAQTGKDLYAYNGITYYDLAGNGYYMAPGSSSASGWSGVSPFSCSGAGLTVTMSYDAGRSRWQSGAVTTRNAFGSGREVRFGYLEMTVTMPAPPTGMKPDVSAWMKLSTAWASPTIWDELDLFETYIASSTDPTLQQTTFHRWPGTKSVADTGVKAHGAVDFKWTATLFDNQPHRFGLLQTRTHFVVYSDVSGSMVELGRIPHASQEELVPWFGLFSIGHIFDLSAVPTNLTYSATLNRVRFYSAP